MKSRTGFLSVGGISVLLKAASQWRWQLEEMAARYCNWAALKWNIKSVESINVLAVNVVLYFWAWMSDMKVVLGPVSTGTACIDSMLKQSVILSATMWITTPNIVYIVVTLQQTSSYSKLWLNVKPFFVCCGWALLQLLEVPSTSSNSKQHFFLSVFFGWKKSEKVDSTSWRNVLWFESGKGIPDYFNRTV